MTQADINFEACERRDAAIAQGMETAGETWMSKASALLQMFVTLRGKDTFMAEDFVEWMKRNYPAIPPPDPRAFGGVIQKAAREGLIERVGYAPANSSNRSPKCVWRVKL